MEFQDNLSLNIFLLLMYIKEKDFSLSELINMITSKLNLVYHKDFSSQYSTIQNLIYKIKNEGIIENSGEGYSINQKKLRDEIKKNITLGIYATKLMENSFLDGFLMDEDIINRIKGL